jgi:hypothetical protein
MAIDPTQLSAPGQVTPPPAEADDDATATSEGRTPEEIEAYWRNRVSKKDKAHQAAEQALRDQIASLSATRSSADSQGTPSAGDSDVAALRRELEEERQARVIDQRKAKYPALAGQGISDAIYATADDASLARLNALADDTAETGRIAPTAPRRGVPAAQKPLKDKSAAELLADLRVASTAMETSLRP